MRLADVVACADAVARLSGRNAKVARLSELLSRLDGEERTVVPHFLSGSLRQGRIGLGPAAASGLRVAPTPASSLEVLEVDRAFSDLAAVAPGAGSRQRRIEALGALLARATAAEQSFLVRLLLGELRQGALEAVLLDAVAEAASLPKAAVRRAHMLGGDLGRALGTALSEGAPGIASFTVVPLSPVRPMLAATASSMEEALAGRDEVALECKLDGARVQVHKDGEDVRVFSRSLADVTAAVPELVEAARAMSARSVVLDGEVVALTGTGRPLPFSTTMSRFGRRLDVEAERLRLPLSLFLFDALFVDGEALIDAPAERRHAALAAVVPPTLLVPRVVTADRAAADRFFADALAAGHEGVLAKDLDAVYEAGHRGASWRKLKPVQALDLVVVGAEWGSGRRTGTLSNLHLAARDPNSGQFIPLGKTFKGLTDALLAEQTQALLSRETHRDGAVVWVRPELVVEIGFDSVMASARYPGGVTLRFARVRGYRPDKTAKEASTIDEVRALLRPPPPT